MMHALHSCASFVQRILDWGGWIFLFFYYRSRLGLSVNIDRLFQCSPFPGSFTPFSVHISHIHTSVTSSMQLRKGKVVTREPKDWSGRFPLPRSEPPVRQSLLLHAPCLLGQNFLILLLVTNTHQSSRLFPRICRGVLLFFSLLI